MKKKLLLLMAAFTMVLTLFAAFGISVSAYSGGNGTETNPYLISKIKDLRELQSSVNSGNTNKGKYFKITAGFSTGANWKPIGSYYSETDNKPFEGTIDGNSYTISLNIGEWCVSPALFGYNKGTIKNLGVYCDINVDSYVCGGVVGWNEGTIHNCYTGGSIKGTSSRCGTIAGFSKGTITNCRNGCSVDGGAELGGVVGYNEGSISSCSSQNSKVVGTGECVGGVAGYNAGTIEISYNDGTVTGGFINAGGVSGYNKSKINNCYNTGTVDGNNAVGGVIGQNSGYVDNCYNIGKSSGGAIVAGRNGSFYNCYYLNTSGEAVSGVGVSKKEDAFASGEVAYLLGNSSIWGQTLGTEKHPTFSNNKIEKRVLRIRFLGGYYGDKEIQYGLQYKNYGKSITLPDDPKESDLLFNNWTKRRYSSGEKYMMYMI